MPEGFQWKNMLIWIVIALLLVALFNSFQHGTPIGQFHDLMPIIINWVPMLFLVGVWIFFLSRMQSGKWKYIPPGQKEQTEAMQAVAKALERIAVALEGRRF